MHSLTDKFPAFGVRGLFLTIQLSQSKRGVGHSWASAMLSQAPIAGTGGRTDCF